MELTKNEQIALALASAMIAAQPKVGLDGQAVKAVVNLFHGVLKEVKSRPPEG